MGCGQAQDNSACLCSVTTLTVVRSLAMGRNKLPKPLQRRNLLRIYLTDAEYKQVKLIARADDSDAASWVRALIQREARRAVS